MVNKLLAAAAGGAACDVRSSLVGMAGAAVLANAGRHAAWLQALSVEGEEGKGKGAQTPDSAAPARPLPAPKPRREGTSSPPGGTRPRPGAVAAAAALALSNARRLGEALGAGEELKQCASEEAAPKESRTLWKPHEVEILLAAVKKLPARMTPKHTMQVLKQLGWTVNPSTRLRVLNKLFSIRARMLHGRDPEEVLRKQKFRRDNSITYKAWAIKALESLPGGQGTAYEIGAVLQADPAIAPKMDLRINPGRKATPQWIVSLRSALKPEKGFRNTGLKRGGHMVYTYDPLSGQDPPDPAAAALVGAPLGPDGAPLPGAAGAAGGGPAESLVNQAAVELLRRLPGVTASQQHPPRPVRCGDYCTISEAVSYVGPIDKTSELQSALNNIAVKKELIIAHHGAYDHVYQFLHRWQRFGYGHIMMVFPDRKLCDRLQPHFTTLGCAWYEDHAAVGWVIEQKGPCRGCYDKWLAHYTGARVVRHGYSTMVMDTDTAPLGDLYGTLSSPPYNEVQLWNQREGNTNVNGGFYYVRNASRSGPVAYLLYDNILKNVRWFEDASPLRRSVGLASNDSSSGLIPGFLCNDQFSLSDSVHGAITGTPQILECVFWHHPRRRESRWEELHQEVYRRAGPRGPQNDGPYEQRMFPVPESLRAAAGNAPQAPVVTSELRVPHARGAWPPERGGYPFSPQLGPLAQKVVDIFREAGDDLPPFPDPNDPSAAPAAAAVPPERFAYLPWWLANTHALGPGNAGGAGWYADWLLPRGGGEGGGSGGAAQLGALVTHLHAGLAAGDFAKLVHMTMEVPYGWDYDLALRLDPRHPPYLATEAGGGAHVPPLLALAPGVAHGGLTRDEYAAMMRGLLRLGLALNRAVVWPWVPCEAPMLRAAGAAYDPAAAGHRVPWGDYMDLQAAIPFAMGATDLKKHGLPCFVCAANKLSCVRGGTRPGASASAPRGLLANEFDHWLGLPQQEGARAITPANTVQDILAAAGGSKAPPPSAPLGPAPLLNLTLTDLELLAAQPAVSVQAAPGPGAAPAAFPAPAPVLWLRGPVAVPALPSPEAERVFEKAAAMCCALQSPVTPECIHRPPSAQRRLLAEAAGQGEAGGRGRRRNRRR
ncbi:hypothetical protein HYH03_014900 [Edaphochlamys debaryana]|uniref:Uncharacterized protein n=1 Tax=Edaphochlamys debaryana TaxID=47281 RepID=A0A835XLV4_9CHLO|nr:hypothetical protein HYH03_014900 [Edaphochlamys debaryana]|eukprot:KAG2486453.1 hypothetical protein HYH03_014900 [Edaphochlamys debaryana]